MAGGASGSKQYILELTESSQKIEKGFVVTKLALGLVHQNASYSLETPSLVLPTQVPDQDSVMAFQRADPRPFVPPGFHHQELHHRATMARAIMRPAPRIHEDYDIVSIDPNHQLHFPAVREVIDEFLVQHMHVGIQDIQPTHLVQGLVRFDNLFDRDLLVANSHTHMEGSTSQWSGIMRHEIGGLSNLTKNVGSCCLDSP
jgi:hypothetical protein